MTQNPELCTYQPALTALMLKILPFLREKASSDKDRQNVTIR